MDAQRYWKESDKKPQEKTKAFCIFYVADPSPSQSKEEKMASNPIAYVLPWNGDFFPIQILPGISPEIKQGLLEEIDRYTESGVRFFKSKRYTTPDGYLIHHSTETRANRYSNYFWVYGDIAPRAEYSSLRQK